MGKGREIAVTLKLSRIAQNELLDYLAEAKYSLNTLTTKLVLQELIDKKFKNDSGRKKQQKPDIQENTQQE